MHYCCYEVRRTSSLCVVYCDIYSLNLKIISGEMGIRARSQIILSAVCYTKFTSQCAMHEAKDVSTDKLDNPTMDLRVCLFNGQHSFLHRWLILNVSSVCDVIHVVHLHQWQIQVLFNRRGGLLGDLPFTRPSEPFWAVCEAHIAGRPRPWADEWKDFYHPYRGQPPPRPVDPPLHYRLFSLL